MKDKQEVREHLELIATGLTLTPKGPDGFYKETAYICMADALQDQKAFFERVQGLIREIKAVISDIPHPYIRVDLVDCDPAHDPLGNLVKFVIRGHDTPNFPKL